MCSYLCWRHVICQALLMEGKAEAPHDPLEHYAEIAAHVEDGQGQGATGTHHAALAPAGEDDDATRLFPPLTLCFGRPWWHGGMVQGMRRLMA